MENTRHGIELSHPVRQGESTAIGSENYRPSASRDALTKTRQALWIGPLEKSSGLLCLQDGRTISCVASRHSGEKLLVNFDFYRHRC
jgi:hypothetical protein